MDAHLLPSQFHITMAKIGTDIDHAAALLREGKLVGIPTETVYGLAGNALDEHAILKMTAEEVNEQIGDQIEYILDGGKCAVGFESTIVSFSDGLPVILRQGALSKENIESTINNTINSQQV